MGILPVALYAPGGHPRRLKCIGRLTALKSFITLLADFRIAGGLILLPYD